MTERKQVTISLYQENIDALKTVSEKLKMSPSKIIRYMINKISVDKKMQEIVSWMDDQEKQKNIGLRIMSNNPTKKEEPSHHSNSSLDPSPESFSSICDELNIDNIKPWNDEKQGPKIRARLAQLMVEKFNMDPSLASEISRTNPSGIYHTLATTGHMTTQEILG